MDILLCMDNWWNAALTRYQESAAFHATKRATAIVEVVASPWWFTCRRHHPSDLALRQTTPNPSFVIDTTNWCTVCHCDCISSMYMWVCTYDWKELVLMHIMENAWRSFLHTSCQSCTTQRRTRLFTTLCFYKKKSHQYLSKDAARDSEFTFSQHWKRWLNSQNLLWSPRNLPVMVTHTSWC